MATLTSNTRKLQLLTELRIARSLPARMKGLIGTKSLAPQEGLWILRCNQIHTFFMSMPIDCVFVNRKLDVVSIIENIQPRRVTWPQWKAHSVFEINAGGAQRLGIQVGEQLHVGD